MPPMMFLLLNSCFLVLAVLTLTPSALASQPWPFCLAANGPSSGRSYRTRHVNSLAGHSKSFQNGFFGALAAFFSFGQKHEQEIKPPNGCLDGPGENATSTPALVTSSGTWGAKVQQKRVGAWRWLAPGFGLFLAAAHVALCTWAAWCLVYVPAWSAVPALDGGSPQATNAGFPKRAPFSRSNEAGRIISLDAALQANS